MRCLYDTALIDFDADTFVGVAERHPAKSPSVDFFHSEEIVIYRCIKNVVLYDYMLKHVVSHHETFMHEFKGREQNVFQKLELPVVSMRHVAAKHAYLIFYRHDTVAVSSHYLPYVRILLVRHYAGAGGEFVRELYEAVIRAHVHAAVCCEFIDCQCNRSHS